MGRWQDVVDAEPAFAHEVKVRFDAGKHKFLATLRQDGSPRISGIEAKFTAGEMWLGMMPGSLKARDLQRDPRFALHSVSADADPNDPAAWIGDAKVSGLAVPVTDSAERGVALSDMEAPGHVPDDIPVFRLDLREVVLTAMGSPADHLVITLWRPGAALQRTKRA